MTLKNESLIFFLYDRLNKPKILLLISYCNIYKQHPIIACWSQTYSWFSRSFFIAF